MFYIHTHTHMPVCNNNTVLYIIFLDIHFYNKTSSSFSLKKIIGIIFKMTLTFFYNYYNQSELYIKTTRQLLEDKMPRPHCVKQY